jgi:hypothetical protein
MIKNQKKFEEFEKNLMRKEKANLKKNIAIFNAMYNEAVKLGIIPMSDPMDGLDTDIKIAKVINSVPKHSKKNSKRTE